MRVRASVARMFRARIAFAFVLALAACGSKSPTPTTVPLPADPVTAPVVAARPADPVAPPAAPEKPMPPLDLKIAAITPTAKLVSAGKGKKSVLTYAYKVGDKQPVEIALDFATTSKTLDGKDSDDTVLPTLVLTGSAETTAVAADGTATYQMTVATATGRDVPGAKVTAAQMQTVLAPTLPGTVLTGTVGKNGAPGAGALHVEKPDQSTEQALELVKLTMPVWPVLPKEPVGDGAKWTVTTPAVLQDRIAITYTTDYELVKRKGATWTVKGTTKVTGADQEFPEGKISAVGGSGSFDASYADGTVFPVTSQGLETLFTASQGGDSLLLTFRSKSTISAPK